MSSPTDPQQRAAGSRPSESGDSRLLAAMIRQARWGAADRGQVLATGRLIDLGDPDSWTTEWIWTAGHAWAAGNAAAAAGRSSRAARAYLHAATYYGAALSQLPCSSDHHRWPALWQRHRECWELAVAHQSPDAWRLELPYGPGSLAGYFFAASGATGRRPLVIVHNGASAPTSAMWGLGGGAAHERGYHWLTFDGPGQQSGFYDRRLLFRPDWQRVLTAIIDAAITLPQVDPSRIAVLGSGQAGYWLAQAMQHDHRLVAAAITAAVVDVRAAWQQALGPELTALHHAGQHSAFDRELHAQLLFAPRQAQWLDARAAPYGHNHRSLSTLLTDLSHYRLPTDLSSLRTPLLIAETEADTPWPQQAPQLRCRAPTVTTIIDEPDPNTRLHRTLDWLQTMLER